MATCNNGITIPTPLPTDLCQGETKSTDCVIYSDAITYLDLPPDSNVTTIVDNLLLSLVDARNRIEDLESNVIIPTYKSIKISLTHNEILNLVASPKLILTSEVGKLKLPTYILLVKNSGGTYNGTDGFIIKDQGGNDVGTAFSGSASFLSHNGKSESSHQFDGIYGITVLDSSTLMEDRAYYLSWDAMTEITANTGTTSMDVYVMYNEIIL